MTDADAFASYSTASHRTRSYNVVRHAKTTRDPRRPWRKRTVWWVESADAPGLCAAADSKEELSALVLSALRDLLGNSQDGIVVWTTDA